MQSLLKALFERNRISTMASVAYVDMPDGSIYRITRLLAPGKSNAKLKKNGRRYLTLGLSLAPAKQSGIGNLCPHATKACRDLCLNISGRTVGKSESTNMILTARMARARLCFQDRPLFLFMLMRELARIIQVGANEEPPFDV
jgi:hypothetical protein